MSDENNKPEANHGNIAPVLIQEEMIMNVNLVFIIIVL